MPPGSYSVSPWSCSSSPQESGARLCAHAWQTRPCRRRARAPHCQRAAWALAEVQKRNQFQDSRFPCKHLTSLVFYGSVGFFKPKSLLIYKFSVVQLYMYTRTHSIYMERFITSSDKQTAEQEAATHTYLFYPQQYTVIRNRYQSLSLSASKWLELSPYFSILPIFKTSY